MSLNPFLARNESECNEYFPLPQPGEVIILRREGISFILTSRRKYSGQGKIFITSTRLVFVRNGKPEKYTDFSSVELPFNLMSGCSGKTPKFHQPLFGANYIEGLVDPVPNSSTSIPVQGRWIITFNKGGCQTFLNVFYQTFQYAQQNSNPLQPNPFINTNLGGVNTGGHSAYYDPTDPSIFYVSQPTPSTATTAGYHCQPGNQHNSNMLTCGGSPSLPLFCPISPPYPQNYNNHLGYVPLNPAQNNNPGFIRQPPPSSYPLLPVSNYTPNAEPPFPPNNTINPPFSPPPYSTASPDDSGTFSQATRPRPYFQGQPLSPPAGWNPQQPYYS